MLLLLPLSDDLFMDKGKMSISRLAFVVKTETPLISTMLTKDRKHQLG